MSNQSKRTASDGGSESENESEEEETTKEKVGAKQQVVEDDDDDEEEEEDDDESSETDSDADTAVQHDTVHKVLRQGPGVKTTAIEPPAGKRGRELNGAKVGSMEEPANKKRKETKDDKGRGQALKSASPSKASKVEQVVKATRSTAVGKGEKARPAPSVKGEGGQGQAQGRKAKPVAAQVAANSKQQTQKTVADKSSPQKAKKTAHWSTNLETSLANLIYGDIKKTGKLIPVSRQDSYWESLLKRLPLEGEMTELQVVDKVKRMRNRFHFLQRKLKEDAGVSHFKNPHEEKLYQIWEGVWGSGNEPIARGPVAAHAASEDDESDDDSAGAAAPRRDLPEAAGHRESEDSSSEEEEDTGNARRKTAGLNQINATGKVPAAITPFVSKPRLEFTPLVRVDKRKASLKDNEELQSGDQHAQHTGEPGKDDGLIHSSLMKRVRADTASMFREFRLQLLDEFRGDRIGGVGSSSGSGSRLGHLGDLEDSAQISQLRKEWQDYRVKEISLHQERMGLVMRELRIEQELLKSRPAT